jgi:predicted methyltransferase MtxX (methanogen marker protein 4)
MVTSHRGYPAPLRGPRANRIPAREQCRARDDAGELDVEIVEPKALGGELVDARRQRAANAAIRTDLTPSEVVGKNQHDVGARRLRAQRERVGDGETRQDECHTHDER